MKDEKPLKNIAVFASGNGTNLQAIIDSIAKKTLRAKLALVVSDRRAAPALKRASGAGVPAVLVSPKDFPSPVSYEAYLLALLEKERVDLVVLAGFMRILSPYFVRKFKNKILNIHPALLPAFKGAHAVEDAFRYGAKVTGVTVHFVDEKVDHGPIIAQESVPITASDTLSTLAAKIHAVEHRVYPRVIASVLEGRLILRGRRVSFPTR